MTRSRFDPLVDAYDAARPSYPDALYDQLESLGGPLRGATVLEVGAGTGIATRALLARGARVVAVDLGTAMLTRLRRRTPEVTGAVLGDGHRLPFAAGVADLLCYAQAWHWMDLDAASAEAVRVLRPGGALACWWNDVDAADAPWWQAQQDRLEAANPNYSRGYRDTSDAADLRATGRFLTVTSAGGHWVREIDFDAYETWLCSKSYVAELGDRLEDFLVAERTSMARAFPSGRIREPFRTRLVVARVA